MTNSLFLTRSLAKRAGHAIAHLHTQSNRHVRDLFFKCDDLRCWFCHVLFERDIYATFMHLFVLCLCINPFSKLDILLSRHIKVKYTFILASVSKTLFIIAQ